MLTSLQALLRLAVLQRLGAFICALATLLAAASTASALELAQTKTRVWGFDFAADNSSGLFRTATPRTHPQNLAAGAEEASGSRLAAEGAPGGIIPSGNAGPIIEVAGTQIRLIGGRVIDGVVRISSFSRMGLP